MAGRVSHDRTFAFPSSSRLPVREQFMSGSTRPPRNKPWEGPKVKLPQISFNLSPTPPQAAWVPMQGASSRVQKLLSKFHELERAEKQKRRFFDPREGVQIKGILNCEDKLDTWNTRQRHRYADVLMADRLRDYQLQAMQLLRERRREMLDASLDSVIDRPSLLPFEMEPAEKSIFRCGKEKSPRVKADVRSKSCEPGFELPQAERAEHAARARSRKTSTLQGNGSLGWTKRVDLNTGRYYYFHHGLGYTSWEPPQEFTREHERFIQLQKRAREEKEAQEEMLELKLLADGNPTFIQDLRSLSCAQVPIDAHVQTSTPPTTRKSMKSTKQSASALTQARRESKEKPAMPLPAVRDLEEMASAADGESAQGTNDGEMGMLLPSHRPSTGYLEGEEEGARLAIRSWARLAEALLSEQEDIEESEGGSSSSGAGMWRVTYAGPEGMTCYVRIRASPSMSGREIGMKKTGELVQAERVLENSDGKWLQIAPGQVDKYQDDQREAPGYMFLNHGEFLTMVKPVSDHERAQQAQAREQRVSEEATAVAGDCGEHGGRARGEAETVESGRYFSIKGSQLAAIEGLQEVSQQLQGVGTRLIVDGKNGRVSRLCDELNSVDAALLIQRNYRVRHSRMRIQRKYMSEDLWRYLMRILLYKTNRTLAVLLNTTVHEMLEASIKEQDKTHQSYLEMHSALLQLQADPKRGCKQDWKRFCNAANIVNTFEDNLD